MEDTVSGTQSLSENSRKRTPSPDFIGKVPVFGLNRQVHLHEVNSGLDERVVFGQALLRKRAARGIKKKKTLGIGPMEVDFAGTRPTITRRNVTNLSNLFYPGKRRVYFPKPGSTADSEQNV